MNRTVVALCGAIAVGGLLVAADPRQAETAASLCRIGAAIEEFSIDHDEYPQLSTMRELIEKVVPRYVDGLPEADTWGNEISIDSRPTAYTIASCGKEAAAACTPAISNAGGESADPRADIILSNGVFLQWPAGLFTELDGGRPSCRHLQGEKSGT